MAKNAVNFTGLIPEMGDSFESATQNTIGSFDGIDTKIGIIDGEITDINNEVDTIDTSLSGHISNTSNPHSVTKSQIGLGNAEDTSDLTKMTVVTFSDLNTTDKTIIGAINETIVTDSAINGNIKIAGSENIVYTHPNHSGDIVSTGDGVTTIQSNVVGNSNLAQMPAKTFKGNKETITGNVQDLTVSEAQIIIQDSTHKFVTEAQISQWNSTSAAIKYYGTQALAIADESNIILGDKIRTLGATTINDGLGSEYIIENSLVDGFSIGNGKYANYLVNSAKTQASGDNSTKIATTAFVNAMLGGNTVPAKNLATNGYVKMANGLILQWGSQLDFSPGEVQTVTFPVAFSTLCFGVQVTQSDSTDTEDQFSTYSRTNSNFVVRLSTTGANDGQTTADLFWFAIGY